jgi:hypothetical protein
MRSEAAIVFCLPKYFASLVHWHTRECDAKAGRRVLLHLCNLWIAVFMVKVQGILRHRRTLRRMSNGSNWLTDTKLNGFLPNCSANCQRLNHEGCPASCKYNKQIRAHVGLDRCYRTLTHSIDANIFLS